MGVRVLPGGFLAGGTPLRFESSKLRHLPQPHHVLLGVLRGAEEGQDLGLREPQALHLELGVSHVVNDQVKGFVQVRVQLSKLRKVLPRTRLEGALALDGHAAPAILLHVLEGLSPRPQQPPDKVAVGVHLARNRDLHGRLGLPLDHLVRQHRHLDARHAGRPDPPPRAGEHARGGHGRPYTSKRLLGCSLVLWCLGVRSAASAAEPVDLILEELGGEGQRRGKGGELDQLILQES
mmetsp:Transcript_4948/g.11548  ORF Transcript_4948/g.11548 Transcript_4948/m.11548 type:complete len:236 (-) Transcript_4948:60-767(-)